MSNKTIGLSDTHGLFGDPIAWFYGLPPDVQGYKHAHIDRRRQRYYNHIVIFSEGEYT